MTAHEANVWMRVRTTKVRKTPIGVILSPSTPEMRRWLNDPSTPIGVRKHIYQWLKYRRENRDSKPNWTTRKR